MVERVCQFCAASPVQVIAGKPISFSCGTRVNDSRPRTLVCWGGWVWKLQDRIATLEAVVHRKKPVTVREAAIQGGWHPEIQKPVPPT